MSDKQKDQVTSIVSLNSLKVESANSGTQNEKPKVGAVRARDDFSKVNRGKEIQGSSEK